MNQLPTVPEVVHLPINLVINPEVRVKILRLEAEMLKGPQFELPLEHFFAKGVYLRKLFIPQGVALTGQIYKYSQICILLEGEMSNLTEDGVQHIFAPHIFSSPAGIKRAGYAWEDSVWCTICGTNETEVEKAEEELYATSFEEFDQYCKQLMLEDKS